MASSAAASDRFRVASRPSANTTTRSSATMTTAAPTGPSGPASACHAVRCSHTSSSSPNTAAATPNPARSA